MSANRLIEAFCAARMAARRQNPGVLAWGQAQWAAWIERQRTMFHGLDRPTIVVLATLASLDDLPLHIGVQQLLASPRFRCAVVLRLATEGMARLARGQARRNGWEGFVQICAEADCEQLIRTVPSETVLADFRVPGHLNEHQMRAAAALCDPRKMKPPITAGSHWFFGRAPDYGEWAAQQRMDEDKPPTAAFRRILLLDTTKLPGFELGFEPDHRLESGTSHPGGAVQITDGTIELPDISVGGQIMVAADQGGRWETIARRAAELIGSDRALRVRPPPALLTTTPNALAVEACDPAQSYRAELGLHVPPTRLKAWMVSAFLNRGGAGNAVIRAFAEGIGCRIAYAEDEPETLVDVPVVWGVLRDSDRILAQAKRQRLYFFYIDHAYFERGHGVSYRITRNGYEAGPVRDCPPDRLAALNVETRPWHKSGREIIVCPPTEYFMAAHGCRDWLEATLGALRKLTDRPIVVRNKPKPGETAVPLPKALETAHALVTHSSNVAIEAVCLGTPVFVSPASAAAPVGRTDLKHIESPEYPDREQWLAHLAYNQFSFDEIRSGRAWKLLLELEERRFV